MPEVSGVGSRGLQPHKTKAGLLARAVYQSTRS